MPVVTSRWQVVLLKKPLRARKMNDDTVCGALAPSSSKVIGPQVVATVAVQVRPAASVLSGAVLNCCGLATLSAVAFGQVGPVGLLLGVLLGVLLAAAERDFLSLRADQLGCREHPADDDQDAEHGGGDLLTGPPSLGPLGESGLAFGVSPLRTGPVAGVGRHVYLLIDLRPSRGPVPVATAQV